MECVLLIGLPGSGKTTFYRQHLGATHDHVSKDVIRHHRRPEQRQAQLLAQALAAGRSVVVDNTQPSEDSRRPVLATAGRYHARAIGYFFSTDARDAVRRNRRRQGRERVPDVAIFTTRKRLDLPSYEEGFERLFIVTLDEDAHAFSLTPLTRP